MENCDIVVTGLGALTAFGAGVPRLARGLEAGRTAVRRPRHSEMAGVAAAAELGEGRIGAALEALPRLSPALAAAARRCTVRGSRSLEASVLVSLEAWLDAGLDVNPVPGERTALVVAGSNLSPRYQREMARRFEEGAAYLDPRYALRFLDTDHVGVVSELLGIRGEGFTVGGASASGNVALTKAWQLLRLDEADACLVIGALADLSAVEWAALRNLRALAGGGDRPAQEICRPFDDDRDGFVPGEGAGCLVLERAAAACQRGARIHAVLAGAAIVLSGAHGPHPDASAEAEVMRRALQRAELAIDAVDYVNAHATSSLAGDEAEVEAIKQVFGARVRETWINSTKGLLGHCLYAAGVVEAIATVVQMNGGFVHASVNLRAPLDADCRFCPGATERATVKTAISNSFGFGGIGSSVVLRHA